MHRPSQPLLLKLARKALRDVQRQAVVHEATYILPWFASSRLMTRVLLENNQIEYSRRRRGASTETTIDVQRHDQAGAMVERGTYVVKPGNPVPLDVRTDSEELEYGFLRMTDSSQYYVQIWSERSYALTHGRSTRIAHYRGAAGALARFVSRLSKPHRKGLNLLCSEDSYQTVIVINLSSSANIVDMHVQDGGRRDLTTLRLPPFGSHLARFPDAVAPGHWKHKFVHMRASAPFELYVSQAKVVNRDELMSIQHVN